MKKRSGFKAQMIPERYDNVTLFKMGHLRQLFIILDF